VAYDPDARCPNYDATIAWAQPKIEMRRYLHQWGGYNLTGDMGAQIFHIWWGPLAQNGKSTILDAWANCAGDYADAGKIETFMEAAHAKGGDAATPALARLPGVRMLRTGEPPNNAKFDESLINQITGQDTLQIRDNFRSFFAVLLQIKVTVACNQPPSIPNATEVIKRRVKVVPFEQTMKGAKNPDGTPKRDENFKLKLVPEMPGIFARLIEGALDWLAYGFVEPGDVTQWTEEYKDENDPLGRFLAYCTEPDPASRIQSSRLHELFAAWSKATGGPEWTQTYFTKKMKAKGHSTKASNGMQWLGLRATREVHEFVDAEGHVKDLSGTEATMGGATSAKAAQPPDDWVPPEWADPGPPGASPSPDLDDDVPF
jgi:P4 family phage/plasmid primase-like protien